MHTRRIRRIIRNLADAVTGPNSRVTGAIEHAAVLRGKQRLKDVSKGIQHLCDWLAFCHCFVDVDERLDEAAVLGCCVVECVGNVCVGQVWLDGCVGGGWCHVEVDEDAVHKGDGAVDERRVPDFGLAYFDRERGNLVLDEGGFYAAGFTDVDF